ncbi:MAG: alpha/beta hydrolase [Halobacteriota archaeon]|nr:alpha/beta hydrolase [Halobacteriota archaeon]
MQNNAFEKIYKKVPEEQKELLKRFRLTHPCKYLTIDGSIWEYISCGQGKETLVLLPGGVRFGETWFKLITALENEYQIISPTYPALSTMAEYVNGVAEILESEETPRAHILGTSFGGWVAQCFIRRYPERAMTMILSNTSGESPYSERFIKFVSIYASLYPVQLIRVGLLRNYLKIISIPDSEREFWKAYLKEKFYLYTTKDDILSQYKCTLDFTSSYKFSKDDLANWSGRVLIMESDDGPGFNAPVREALKNLYPLAKVHTFHNAGHTPGYTNPREYSSVLREFLRESWKVWESSTLR